MNNESKKIDGREIQKREKDLLIEDIKRLGIKAHIRSFYSGNEHNQEKYNLMKQNMARELGFQMDLEEVKSEEQLADSILKANADPEVTGILVQMPVPWPRERTQKILDMIDPRKDIDGLTTNSPFKQATVLSVEDILMEVNAFKKNYQFVVVGGVRGLVGRGVVKALEEKDEKVLAVSKDDPDLPIKTQLADVLISSTGIKDLIKPEMIKDGAILLDIGLRDISESCYDKCSRYTPKIGGSGPPTIIELMKSALKAAVDIQNKKL